MFDDIFKNKKNQKIIKEMSEVITGLKSEIKRLEATLKCKSDFFLEKETLQKENDKIAQLEDEKSKILEEKAKVEEKLELVKKFIPLHCFEENFQVPLEVYFHENRFQNFIKEASYKKISFVQELDIKALENIYLEEKLKKEIEARIENFKIGNVSWATKTYLLKGEKVSKCYNKNRKFLSILTMESIEYMGEMNLEIFKILPTYNFLEDEINILKIIYTDYIKVYQN